MRPGKKLIEADEDKISAFYETVDNGKLADRKKEWQKMEDTFKKGNGRITMFYTRE